MDTRNLFKKYNLQNRRGASLENAIVALIRDIENTASEDLRRAFKEGVSAARRDSENISADIIADENGY